MNKYKDLTEEDVLQAGDETENYDCSWQMIPANCLGLTVASLHPHKFRRPLTTREIVAAARVKFEAWCIREFSWTDFSRTRSGVYAGLYKKRLPRGYWPVWCAALGIDPMGDC
jgi:hypothetical protein